MSENIAEANAMDAERRAWVDKVARAHRYKTDKYDQMRYDFENEVAGPKKGNQRNAFFNKYIVDIMEHCFEEFVLPIIHSNCVLYGYAGFDPSDSQTPPLTIDDRLFKAALRSFSSPAFRSEYGVDLDRLLEGDDEDWEFVKKWIKQQCRDYIHRIYLEEIQPELASVFDVLELTENPKFRSDTCRGGRLLINIQWTKSPGLQRMLDGYVYDDQRFTWEKALEIIEEVDGIVNVYLGFFTQTQLVTTITRLLGDVVKPSFGTNYKREKYGYNLPPLYLIGGFIFCLLGLR